MPKRYLTPNFGQNKVIIMRKIIALICFLTLSSIPTPMNAQQKTDSSLIYIHQEKASFKSQFFQKVASIFGVKKYIEKSILKGKYNQAARPIPKSIRNNFNLTENIVQGRQIWTLKPQQNASDKVVLYLHGGAYYWNVSKYNWSFTEELLKETNATFIIPDYPLAPHSTCEQVFDFMSELYQELTSKYHPDNIIIMGESAGAGLALGFTMFLRNEDIPQPSQLLLLAPWLDVTMSNPEILKVDKRDRILGIKGLQIAGKGYAGGINTSNYKISPINGDLSNLARISIFVGTHDLFVADARKLKDKAHSLGIPLKYYEYPKMFHIWIFIKKLKEAEPAKKQIVSLILEEVHH